jgi:hypothetical protein
MASNRNEASLCWMFVLPMIASRTSKNPAIGRDALNQDADLHL